MKRTSFETRERAAELLKEAVAVWKQSSRSEQLEGLEEDPVFNMLIMALAQQANELDADIAYLCDNLWNEFASEMVPYAIGGPTPARLMVSTMPVDSVGEVKIDSFQKFYLKGDDKTQFQFLPLFNSRAIAADISSVVRLDARRWLVKLGVSSEVHDLGGFCFAISDGGYADLILRSAGREMKLIKPWDYADVPYTEPFSINTMLFNHSPMYNAASESMDLFAIQSRHIYLVDGTYPVGEGTREIDLEFEFTGIDETFSFDKSKVALNINVLVNAEVESTILSNSSPYTRIPDGKSLMHLLHPSDSQLFENDHIRVIRAGGDRFNPSELTKLLNCIISKFNTDYFAFGHTGDQNLDEIMTQLAKLVIKFQQEMGTRERLLPEGTYLCMLRGSLDREFSVPVSYVMTSASAVNPYLGPESTFLCPAGLDESQTTVLGNPVLPEDPIRDSAAMWQHARYYMSTCDRIVTPADIKIFCRTKLMISFGIVEDMINSVKVKTCLDNSRPSRYCTKVDISLSDNRFVSKNFVGRIPEVENMLSKMMMVRSAGMYPIEVKITID